MTDFLVLATVFLIAGVIAVPLASRLGLGSVLGYLIAGVVISPVLAGLGVDVIAIQHFAEFGVVMMLFLVGLELEPKMLWGMRARLLGLGGMQVLITALMFVIGIALLMTLVGLSPALGTFLAGVVLANSEYRHELESDIDPFRGLLLGLFFMTVGASVNFALLFDNIGTVLGLTLGLMALKTIILLVLARVFKLEGSDKFLFGLGLAQAGEFGFVLLSFTVANNVIPPAIADQLLLVVALSMMLTPALFILHEKVIAPKLQSGEAERDADNPQAARVIIAGHGRFGGIVNRMLIAAGYQPTVLDYSTKQLEMLRKFDFRAFYGDATRPDLLHAAGMAEADVFVVAIDNEHAATEVVRYVRNTYPKVHIVARALNRHHVYALYAAGANDIIRDTFDSAVRAGRSAYEALGIHPYEAENYAREFVDQDRAVLREAAEFYDPNIDMLENQAYQEKIKERRKEQQEEFLNRGNALRHRTDRGWNRPTKEMLDAVMKDD